MSRLERTFGKAITTRTFDTVRRCARASGLPGSEAPDATRARPPVLRFQHPETESTMDLADQKCVPCRGGVHQQIWK